MKEQARRRRIVISWGSAMEGDCRVVEWVKRDHPASGFSILARRVSLGRVMT
jgi:hypothetical protein